MLVTDSFGNWLAGFIDGEGCFQIVNPSAKANYHCRFEIRLRGDDLAILKEIQEATGLGSIVSASARPDRPNQNPMAAWIITSKTDCLGLVMLLTSYPLRAKKLRDFVIWREAVTIWASLERRGKSRVNDWSRMSSLAQELKEVRKFITI